MAISSLTSNRACMIYDEMRARVYTTRDSQRTRVLAEVAVQLRKDIYHENLWIESYAEQVESNFLFLSFCLDIQSL